MGDQKSLQYLSFELKWANNHGFEDNGLMATTHE
jgi:hypothetical protein